MTFCRRKCPEYGKTVGPKTGIEFSTDDVVSGSGAQLTRAICCHRVRISLLGDHYLAKT